MFSNFSAISLRRERWRRPAPFFPTLTALRASLLGATALILTSLTPGNAAAQTDTAECAPKLVRAVTHFPLDIQQFYGDGVVELGVEVDRLGRVVSAQVANPRTASPELFKAARASALREWAFDVTGCGLFPAHATVRVEYQRPPRYTFSAMRAHHRDPAASLPAGADCERNETPRFAGDTIISCLVTTRPVAVADANTQAAANTEARASTAAKESETTVTHDRGGR
jgi:hypothetical protein